MTSHSLKTLAFEGYIGLEDDCGAGMLNFILRFRHHLTFRLTRKLTENFRTYIHQKYFIKLQNIQPMFLLDYKLIIIF